MLKIPFDQYLKDLAAYTWTYNYHGVLTASTNPTLVKADPTLVYGIIIGSASGSISYLKLHNTSVQPVAGVTPVAMTLMYPTSVPMLVMFDSPILFDKGLAFTTTPQRDDGDTTSILTPIVVDIRYR